MTRMLGVICGAAIAIALLTWLVGVPQFTSERPVDASRVALVELPDPVVPRTRAAGPAVGPPAGSPSVAGAPEASPESLAVASEPKAEAESDPVTAPDTGPASELPVVAPDDAQWFAFWSPFRSEVAANGFVKQLQRVTGLDYRVVKLEPGVYEVAFAYADDAEIDGYLSTISAATGLDLPESR